MDSFVWIGALIVIGMATVASFAIGYRCGYEDGKETYRP